MTEAEWLACEDPLEMVETALESERASDRTYRLFVAAFWKWQAVQLLDSQRHRLSNLADATEEWAEAGWTPRRIRASRVYDELFHNRNARSAVQMTVQSYRWTARTPEALALQPRLLRDIFGNPFRPFALDPAWLTSDVLALARSIYEENAFDRMPILADALQDAGCANEDVLTHCRDAKQLHVRGCWVLDLLTGRG